MCLTMARPRPSTATVSARARAIHPIEPLKDALARVGRDARAVIGDPEFGIAVGVAMPADGDGAVGAAIFDGVFDEIEQDLLEAVRIGAGG